MPPRKDVTPSIMAEKPAAEERFVFARRNVAVRLTGVKIMFGKF